MRDEKHIVLLFTCGTVYIFIYMYIIQCGVQIRLLLLLLYLVKFYSRSSFVVQDSGYQRVNFLNLNLLVTKDNVFVSFEELRFYFSIYLFSIEGPSQT